MQLCDGLAHGGVRSNLVHAPDERDPAEGHRRTHTVVFDPHQYVSALAGALDLIDFRIGLPADEYVRLLDHLGRHVGVDVELGENRHVLSDALPEGREDVPVAVVDPLDDHGAVQLQQDTVDRSARIDSVQQVVQDGVEDVAGRRRARGGVGEDGRDEFETVIIRGLDESADRCACAPECGNQLVADEVAKPLVAEIVPSGLHRSEGAGLVTENADGDSHSLPRDSVTGSL